MSRIIVAALNLAFAIALFGHGSWGCLVSSAIAGALLLTVIRDLWTGDL